MSVLRHISPRWRRFYIALVITLGSITLLELVRGHRILPGPRDRQVLLGMLRSGSPWITHQRDLDRVGALALDLVLEDGGPAGPFHLEHLDRLDFLEKLHHLVHAPFTGIREMYCDIWINSLTTYGRRERTWGVHETNVRPALKLPVLLLLLDRLGRRSTTLSEHVGAVPEAITGMEVHTLPGRARLWYRLLERAARDPDLAGFIAWQLSVYQWEATDFAEASFWSEMANRPLKDHVIWLATHSSPSVPAAHPALGVSKLPILLATFRPAGASVTALDTRRP